jgi:hypothetical protein
MANYKKWSDAEIQYIKDNCKLYGDDELASKLSNMTGENITYGMVRRQRRKLNIDKQRGRPRKDNKFKFQVSEDSGINSEN